MKFELKNKICKEKIKQNMKIKIKTNKIWK